MHISLAYVGSTQCHKHLRIQGQQTVIRQASRYPESCLADDKGDENDNMVLSKLRAASVRDYLISQGIACVNNGHLNYSQLSHLPPTSGKVTHNCFYLRFFDFLRSLELRIKAIR